METNGAVRSSSFPVRDMVAFNADPNVQRLKAKCENAAVWHGGGFFDIDPGTGLVAFGWAGQYMVVESDDNAAEIIQPHLPDGTLVRIIASDYEGVRYVSAIMVIVSSTGIAYLEGFMGSKVVTPEMVWRDLGPFVENMVKVLPLERAQAEQNIEPVDCLGTSRIH